MSHQSTFPFPPAYFELFGDTLAKDLPLSTQENFHEKKSTDVSSSPPFPFPFSFPSSFPFPPPPPPSLDEEFSIFRESRINRFPFPSLPPTTPLLFSLTPSPTNGTFNFSSTGKFLLRSVMENFLNIIDVNTPSTSSSSSLPPLLSIDRLQSLLDRHAHLHHNVIYFTQILRIHQAMKTIELLYRKMNDKREREIVKMNQKMDKWEEFIKKHRKRNTKGKGKGKGKGKSNNGNVKIENVSNEGKWNENISMKMEIDHVPSSKPSSSFSLSPPLSLPPLLSTDEETEEFIEDFLAYDESSE